MQAVYSGVSVYEMEIQGIACMRRRNDGWLNATQILKIAGVDKGKRTKVLEKEILTGEHEKVQGGYGKYQGTWISYKRGREFCRQYGVEDILRPLLDYDVSADGTGGGGHGQETPTKEQAMAANRKRFYNSSLDAGRPNGGPMSNGTFFQNISPTTSVALAAMNKAARLNSPAPRPPSAQRPANMRQPSQQDGFPGGSQQSMVSNDSFGPDGKFDSGYSTQPNGTGEPPRKRMRPDSRDGMGPPDLPLDVSMRSATPTEPNESFLYDPSASQEVMTNGSGEPIASAPLPSPTTDAQNDKLNLILDLFAEPHRSDYATHPALTQLHGEDFNMPLDASANNALHWAATLAKVPLLKMLIQRGANIWRGNAAGQSPLISAVIVNNCWEHSCFPELLELLNPLIEVRDIQGRTVLHHIAVSSGIKGRAPSSKYYLEALLEFLVRIGTSANSSTKEGASMPQIMANITTMRANGDSSSQESNGPALQNSKGAVSLVRFLSHIVNARDKAGNTALNLVARIGNRSIIQQLLEIHADPSLPNHKGVSAKDFGVGVAAGEQRYINGGLASQQSTQSFSQAVAGTQQTATSDEEVEKGDQVEDLGQDVISSMTSMLTQNMSAHKDLLRTRTEQIDRLNKQIQEFSALQKADLERLHDLQGRVKLRGERQAKIANLKRSIAEKKRKRSKAEPDHDYEKEDLPPVDEKNGMRPDLEFSVGLASPSGAGTTWTPDSMPLADLPSPKTLRARLNAYLANNSSLQRQADELKSRSSELEGMYRKVVSLCTGVAEDKVEENLGALLAAVESERGALGEQEVGRVRDFLRRVDGAATVEC